MSLVLTLTLSAQAWVPHSKMHGSSQPIGRMGHRPQLWLKLHA